MPAACSGDVAGHHAERDDNRTERRYNDEKDDPGEDVQK
jgi:hypothetical protein